MRVRAGLIVFLLLFASVDNLSVSAQGPNRDFETFKREMMPRVGRKITVVGVLASGKLGWLVNVDKWFVYIYVTKHSSTSKTNRLGQFEGRTVKVTGTLRYFPRPQVVKSDGAVAVPPEHFYFDAAEVRVVTLPQPGFPEAEKAWPQFFALFQEAVKKRDRAALKQMMIPDFFYTLGHHASDRRDEAFAYWDDPLVKGWKALDRVLAQGTAKASARWYSQGEEQGPKRIAPPAANIHRNILRDKVPWYAEFEFRRDGKWYWVTFIECCD
jgi:hypothetical protein